MALVEKTGITDKSEVFKILTELGYKDLYIWSDPPETFYDWHTHPYNEVRWVLKGEILIGTEKGNFLLKAGGELLRIIDTELRVGLHPLRGALPPRAGSLRPYSFLSRHTTG